MTKIIKRYSNRKLYDTEQSTYITLDEIQEMVKDGEDIRIIDNKTKEDITNVTLAQIIFEQEKSHKRLLPLSALRSIIQSGEDFVQSKIESPVTQFRDDVKRRAEAIAETPKAVREFIDSTQRSLDEMQSRIDERMRGSVDQLTHIPEMRREMISLENRIIALEQSVHRLERTMQELVPTRPPTATDPHGNLP
jgi:polyhydroxyalkanoate synthesis repressor PhaR